MKTITQRELRNGSAAIMDEVERGETFRVTRRGVPIAEVRPIHGEKFMPMAEIKRAFTGMPAHDHARMRAEADAVFGEERVDE